MYQSIYKWEEAIDIAEAKNHPNADKLKRNYTQWLQETEQHEVAALLKEKEHDYLGAINLYLRANIPIRAAKILMNSRELIHDQDLLTKIATSLIKSELFENVIVNLITIRKNILLIFFNQRLENYLRE